MEKSKQVKKKFDALYAKWEKIIRDPKIQVSSRPQDYIDNESYRKIVKLGKDALPFILEKINKGVFFMNQAALEIGKLNMDEIIKKEKKRPRAKRVEFFAVKRGQRLPKYISEQQKSELILKYMALQDK